MSTASQRRRPAALARAASAPAVRRLRVVVVGPPQGDALIERLYDAGVEVIGEPDTAGLATDWESFVRTADAGIDFTVSDGEAKRRAAGVLDRLLPASAPLLTCCHATSATVGRRHR